MKTCILLINLGTPDSPSTGDVRKYLRQFLNDPRVIDINPIGRFFLVNGIIVPFRAPKSAKIYKQLWTKEGSPLLFHGINLKEKLQKIVPENVTVELAMRYQSPSIASVLEKIKKEQYDKIIIFPLFPHYASSSTGSAVEEVMRLIKKWWVIPELKIISQFYDHPGYLNAFAASGKKYSPENYDHVLFSFHGLPERQVDKTYTDGKLCSDHNCEHEINETNHYCYKAVCFETAKQIAAKLNLSKEKYTVAFQSRLGRSEWIKPYSDKRITELAQQGVKKLLVFSPAFIADCLETTVEIGSEYKELFMHSGGQELQLVESLNSNDDWVNAVKEIALGN